MTLDLDGYPRLLHHSLNVLVIQTIGGSSSAVFVLHFRRGKLQPLLSAPTRGLASIAAAGDGEEVVVTVPPDRRVTSPGNPARFRVRIEAEVARP